MRMVHGLAAAALLSLLAGAAGAADEKGPVATGKTGLGDVFVDSHGMTLYTFANDQPGKSTCYDQCAKNWPPYLAGADAKPSDEWTIIERTDGTRQWAYEGKPVYLWVNDLKPGDTTGQGVGGKWAVARP